MDDIDYNELMLLIKQKFGTNSKSGQYFIDKVESLYLSSKRSDKFSKISEASICKVDIDILKHEITFKFKSNLLYKYQMYIKGELAKCDPVVGKKLYSTLINIDTEVNDDVSLKRIRKSLENIAKEIEKNLIK